MKFSLKKIAQNDKFERLKLLYAMKPNKVRILMRSQGFDVSSQKDLQNVLNDVKNGKKNIMFDKIERLLPLSVFDIKTAKAKGIEIV